MAGFGVGAYNIGQRVYYAAMDYAIRANIWIAEIVYGYSAPGKTFTPNQLQHFQKILQKDGLNALIRSQRSILKRLAEHSEKLANGLQYPSSVEKEIETFTQELAAIEHILKELGH